MKQILLALCIIISFNTYAQIVYLADTALVTDVGYGGAPASCKANGLTYNSLGMDRTHNVWAADVFTVPTGATWVFDTVIVFGYQYGSSLTSPFISCNLQIYNGTPGAGGTVVWGDTVTNVLNSTAFTGIYKVDTYSSDDGLLSTKRPIMFLKLHLSPAPSLTAGTYWLAWSATSGVSSSSSASTPFKVLPGRVNPSGQMARVFTSGAWTDVTDNSNAIGLNMIIEGKNGLAAVTNQSYNSESRLYQNVPNPFRNTTSISYNIAENGYAKLVIYNMLGQIVTTLADGNSSKGMHHVSFNANNLPDGIYYCKLSTAIGTESMQMILAR